LAARVGAVVTCETLDEVQDQVQERGRPARCYDITVVHDHPANRHVYRRVAAAQQVA
jgi:hypothetical protein